MSPRQRYHHQIPLLRYEKKKLYLNWNHSHQPEPDNHCQGSSEIWQTVYRQEHSRDLKDCT